MVKAFVRKLVGEIVNSSFYEAIQQEDFVLWVSRALMTLKTQKARILNIMAIFEVYPEVNLADLEQGKAIAVRLLM